METIVHPYQEERSKLYKLLMDRVSTNYDRLHYLCQDANSRIVFNKDLKSISYNYDLATPVMQELFPDRYYEFIEESVPGYFSLQATDFEICTGYTIQATENVATVEIPSGKVLVSFGSQFYLFDFPHNTISGPYAFSKSILDPHETLSYEIPKEVHIPVDFKRHLFFFRNSKDQDISSCQAALSSLEYLTQYKHNLIEFIELLHKHLMEMSELDPIRVFFDWTKFFQSVYIDWIALSIDKSIVIVDRKKNQSRGIIIPIYSVSISITDE